MDLSPPAPCRTRKLSPRENAAGGASSDTSEESRGSDREDRGGAGTGLQGRVEIELNVGGQPQALEDRVTVVELGTPLRIPGGLRHGFQVGLVPKESEPGLVQLVALEWIVADPTPCD